MSIGGRGGIKKVSTMNKDQEKMWRQVAGYIAPQIGKDITPYAATTPWAPGVPQEWTVPISGQAEGTQNQFLTTLSQALQGISPAETERQYRANILPAQQRMFNELTLPGVEEAYVGSGLSASSARQAGVAHAYETFGEAQGQTLADLIASNQQAAYGALGAGQNLYSTDQLILDQEMQRRLAEYQRTQAVYSPYMERAFQLLDMQTQAAYGKSGSSNPLSALTSLLSMGLIK